MLAAELSAFGRPDEVIELVEQADPGVPGPGEAIVDAELCPINPADLLNLEGSYGAVPPPLPMTIVRSHCRRSGLARPCRTPPLG